jgi:hypothetical protein
VQGKSVLTTRKTYFPSSRENDTKGAITHVASRHPGEKKRPFFAGDSRFSRLRMSPVAFQIIPKLEDGVKLQILIAIFWNSPMRFLSFVIKL